MQEQLMRTDLTRFGTRLPTSIAPANHVFSFRLSAVLLFPPYLIRNKMLHDCNLDEGKQRGPNRTQGLPIDSPQKRQ